jgi:hypothetical protein
VEVAVEDEVAGAALGGGAADAAATAVPDDAAAEGDEAAVEATSGAAEVGAAGDACAPPHPAANSMTIPIDFIGKPSRPSRRMRSGDRPAGAIPWRARRSVDFGNLAGGSLDRARGPRIEESGGRSRLWAAGRRGRP